MNLRMLVLSVLVLVFLGCATGRTVYGPAGERGGYSDSQVNTHVHIARFAGNAYTSSRDAELFSMVRALEVCRQTGKPFFRLYGILNQSQAKTVARTSTSHYQSPTTFSASANSNAYYGQNSAYQTTEVAGQVDVGQATAQTATWNETYNFPVYDAYYSCRDRVWRTEVELSNVPPEAVGAWKKDRMGGVQVTSVMPNSCNRGILKVGDIVLEINGERIAQDWQYVDAIDFAKSPESPTFKVVRDGKVLTLRGRAVDATAQYAQDTDRLLSTACAVSEIAVLPICYGRSIASE